MSRPPIARRRVSAPAISISVLLNMFAVIRLYRPRSRTSGVVAKRISLASEFKAARSAQHLDRAQCTGSGRVMARAKSLSGIDRELDAVGRNVSLPRRDNQQSP